MSFAAGHHLFANPQVNVYHDPSVPMSPVAALVFALLISIAPSLMFLGLVRGLRALQNNPTVTLASATSGVDATEVTFGDAWRGFLGKQRDTTERPNRDSRF